MATKVRLSINICKDEEKFPHALFAEGCYDLLLETVPQHEETIFLTMQDMRGNTYELEGRCTSTPHHIITIEKGFTGAEKTRHIILVNVLMFIVRKADPL
jgi:hypothetical protein